MVILRCLLLVEGEVEMMRRSLFAVTILAVIGVSVVFTSNARAQALNPVWWGADPTGNNDSTAAINKAIAAATFSAFGPASRWMTNWR